MPIGLSVRLRRATFSASATSQIDKRLTSDKEVIMKRAGSYVVIPFLVALISAAVPHAGFAQSDPRIGTWKLNLAKSKYDPGPPPKSQTTKFEAAANGAVKDITEGIAADGSRVAYSWTAKNDGKDYPEIGVGTPNGADTIAIKRIDEYTFESIQKKAGKVVLTNRTVYSKDGKLRTITGKGTNTSGQPTNNVVVYDRQ